MMANMNMLIFLMVVLAHNPVVMSCPGCPLEKDVNDPLLHKYLSETIQSYKLLPKGTEQEQTTLLKINRASTQVVNGVKYEYDFVAQGIKTQRLYHCHLVAVKQAWLGEENISEYNCKPLSSANRNKRSLFGGEVDIDVSKGLPELHQVISKELNKQHESQDMFGVVKFVKASKQVVAGILLKATFEVAPYDIDCSKNKDNCGFQTMGHKLCKIELRERAWINKKEVTSFECRGIHEICAGCPQAANVNDPSVQQCLQRTLFNLNSTPNATKKWRLLNITNAQTQVVAGIKYIVEFEAEDESKAFYKCKAVMVSQPWLSPEPSLDEFNCSPELI